MQNRWVLLLKNASDPLRYLFQATVHGRSKNPHIGSGNDDGTLLLPLLLPRPERAAGSSSPARRGEGRLHRWARERGENATKRGKKENVVWGSCSSQKRGVEKRGRVSLPFFYFFSSRLLRLTRLPRRKWRSFPPAKHEDPPPRDTEQDKTTISQSRSEYKGSKFVLV